MTVEVTGQFASGHGMSIISVTIAAGPVQVEVKNAEHAFCIGQYTCLCYLLPSG